MDKIFFILYTIVVSIAYAISLPYIFYISKRKSKYKESIPARFFLKKNRPLKSNGVWFHVCSFGEARAIYPIIEKLPNNLLRATTTTKTGYNAISKKIYMQSRYLPFEPLLFFWIRPQKVLVVMEAEFWYLLFYLAKKRGTKNILINARMSDRSFPKYKKFKFLYKMIFSYIDEVYAQTHIDKERLEELGAKNVRVIGNIKLANITPMSRKLSKPKALLICGASTHNGEEELILDAFIKLKKNEPDARLIIVPRHPERFYKVSLIVKELAKTHNYSWHNYSDNEAFNSDIVVANILGELVNIYAISDIVILGGAFEPIGGHNAAEASQFGCKIISGENYFNQKDVFAMIDGIAIVSKADLSDVLVAHRNLKQTKIINRTNINPIIETIRKEL